MNSLEVCRESLNSADETDRIYAAEDIGYLNAPEGVAILLDRLHSEPSRMVRDVIFQALIRIDADAAILAAMQLLESADPQTRNQAVDVLRQKGVQSIPLLSELMRTADKDVRKLILDALTGVPAAEAAGIYAAALSDHDVNVVITAVENLGRMQAEAFRSQVEDLLRPGSHPMLIAACMEALVGIGGPDSLVVVERFSQQLAKLPDFLLVPYLKVVGAWGSNKEFAEVTGILAVRGAHMRAAILEALLALYPRCDLPGAIDGLLEPLRAIIEGQDPPLCRYQAIRLLHFWSTHEDVYTLLVSCLSSDERLIRLGAAESLRATGRPEVEAILAAHALDEIDEEILQVLHC